MLPSVYHFLEQQPALAGVRNSAQQFARYGQLGQGGEIKAEQHEQHEENGNDNDNDNGSLQISPWLRGMIRQYSFHFLCAVLLIGYCLIMYFRFGGFKNRTNHCI